MIQYRVWAFLAACFAVLLFTTSSGPLMFLALFAGLGCIVRALWWRFPRAD